MHREIQDQIEKFLSNPAQTPRFVAEHMEQCAECREEIAGMRQHSEMLRALQPPAGATLEPRPGFYARVMERIEAEGPVSIWNIFIESAFGRRIAYASVALAVVLGVYLVTSEISDESVIAEQTVSQPAASDTDFRGDALEVLSAVPVSTADFGAPAAAGDLAAQLLLQQRMMLQQQVMMERMIDQMNNSASQDEVLVNLATYREQ